jgi:hypothetical protein
LKECVHTWGDLARWLKGRRDLKLERSEKSAEVVVVVGVGEEAETESEGPKEGEM